MLSERHPPPRQPPTRGHKETAVPPGWSEAPGRWVHLSSLPSGSLTARNTSLCDTPNLFQHLPAPSGSKAKQLCNLGLCVGVQRAVLLWTSTHWGGTFALCSVRVPRPQPCEDRRWSLSHGHQLPRLTRCCGAQAPPQKGFSHPPGGKTLRALNLPIV